ncbi:MAG: hypothetical protein RL757_3364 [Bacteroidota bacterium]|jgi:hypothetical protein
MSNFNKKMLQIENNTTKSSIAPNFKFYTKTFSTKKQNFIKEK